MTTLVGILSILALTATAPPEGSALGAGEPTQAAQELSVEALCRRGEHRIEDGGVEALRDSRRLYALAAQLYPDHACGHAGLSRSLAALVMRLVEQDDSLIDAALKSARRAVELDPRSASARAALAGALMLDLQPTAAEQAASEALQLDSLSVPALQASCFVRMASGRSGEARKAIESALALRPDLPASHHALGNVLLISGQGEDAIASYRNALSLANDYKPSTFQLASAFELMGDYTTAGRILGRILSEHPEDSPLANLFMAQSLMKRDGWEVALPVLERATFTTRRGLSQGTVLYLKGICYEQLGRMDEARAAFREVIDAYPDATVGSTYPERLIYPAYEGLGRIYLQARDADAAAAVMEEGASKADASLDLFLRLARLYEDYHLPEKAIALLDKAMARDLTPKTAGTQLAASVLLARLGRQNSDAQALGRLVESLERRRGQIDALGDYVLHLEAVRALSIAGRGDLALEWLRHAVGLGYTQFEWMRKDPELDGLRAARGFEELVKSAQDGAAAPHAPRTTD